MLQQITWALLPLLALAVAGAFWYLRRHKPTDYAASHCRQCVAGWTRTRERDGAELVCLLDRQPIPTGITNCDLYEPRDAPGSTAARLR